MKFKKTILEKVSKEKTEREKSKSDELNKIQAERVKAENEYNAACSKLEKAKNDLDASEMIEAGIVKQQSENVIKMFDDAINTKKAKQLFTAEESRKYIQDLKSEAEGVNATAAKEAAALLNQIEKIINNNQRSLSEYNDLINYLSGSNSTTTIILQHQILANMNREIYHDKSCFKDVFESN